MRVSLTVDGVRHDFDMETGRTLADLLRTQGGISAYRVACLDGTCGACAVLMDGDTIHSCLMLAVQAVGAQIRTSGAYGLPRAAEIHRDAD